MRSRKLLVGLTIAIGTLAAQPKGGFAVPPPAKAVTIKAIPGVISAGMQWKVAWQGTENADGIASSGDGGILFAQEQDNRISKLDKNDKFSVFLTTPHGPGAVSAGPKNRIVVVERTCTDPGQKPDQCKEPTGVAALTPVRKVLADNIGGKSLGRVNDLTVSRTGHIYMTSGGVFHITPTGEVSTIGENIRPNGIILSTNEKTLYVTNGQTIVAFDVQPDGSVKNQHEFGKLNGGGGDGMTVDSTGRLYVTDQTQGIQVFSPDGKNIGLIPTPRTSISTIFSGPGKKTLYVACTGALDSSGKEIAVPQNVRNTAMTIYKIPMDAQGFKGRMR